MSKENNRNYEKYENLLGKCFSSKGEEEQHSGQHSFIPLKEIVEKNIYSKVHSKPIDLESYILDKFKLAAAGLNSQLIEIVESIYQLVVTNVPSYRNDESLKGSILFMVSDFLVEHDFQVGLDNAFKIAEQIYNNQVIPFLMGSTETEKEYLKKKVDLSIKEPNEDLRLTVPEENEPQTALADNSIKGESSLQVQKSLTVLDEAFFKSVKDGDLSAVKKAIAGGIDVNIRDKYKDTALHHASGKGYQDIARLLLEHGALVNCDDCKSSPLEWAVLYNHPEVVKLLLSYGASPNAFDYIGLTALHTAAENGSIEILKLLLDKGGMPDILSQKTENSLIHSAAIGIKQGNGNCWDLIKWMLENYEEQVDPFYANNDNKEPRDILDSYDWSFAEKYDDMLEILGYYTTEDTQATS